MIKKPVCCSFLLVIGLCLTGYAADELSTSPVNSAELEASYTAAIERRAVDILDALDLGDSAKAAEVRDVIVKQYRALRARDAVIDAYLRALEEADEDATASKRATLSGKLTRPLHEMYVETLSAYLTSEQVEVVKDMMTYNKVKVTFDTYCDIIPKLTESERAMIVEVLKAAREEAIDGGSSTEKHAIFDRYKDQINARLRANGHDVEKAFKDWETKQGLAGGAQDAAPGASN